MKKILPSWMGFAFGMSVVACSAFAQSGGPAIAGAAPAAPASSGAAVAGAAPAAAALANPQANPWMSVLPFVLMFGVMYFLMIRPQQKKLKEQQSMLGALKQGDEVVTSSGFLGKIAGINDKIVTLEVADNVRVKVLKSQVAQVVKGTVQDLARA